jgi:hypothetical protein
VSMHRVIASRLVIAMRHVMLHCFFAAFCLFGCSIIYPSMLSALVARR